MPGIGYLGFLLFIAFVIITNIVKILKEYERGVIFTLGRVGRRAAGPGLAVELFDLSRWTAMTMES